MDLAFRGFLQPKCDQWPETTATVADCHSLSGIWDQSEHPVHLYSVRFVYWVKDQMYSGCFRSQQCYDTGSPLALRYDPRHPERTTCDPPEKLRTELLVALSVGLAALYFVFAFHR
jgi:Protein of unknown function (DUF3592)